MHRHDLTLYLDDRFGPVRLALTGPGPAAAVRELVPALEARGVRVTRVDTGDWLTLGDVARRVGRSREAVRLWAAGRAGPGGFPPPLNPGRKTLFWSWAEVGRWLRDRAAIPAGGTPDLVAVDLAVRLRTLLPGCADPASVRALVPGPGPGPADPAGAGPVGQDGPMSGGAWWRTN